MNDLVLCYVDEPWAWFTSQPLHEAHGDDWNDRPYEHNAGPPYEYVARIDEPRGREPWEIVRVAFTPDMFATPRWNHWNSPYCVFDINAGARPWLIHPLGAAFGPPTQPVQMVLHAGASLPSFIAAVAEVGGDVWLPPHVSRRLDRWREAGGEIDLDYQSRLIRPNPQPNAEAVTAPGWANAVLDVAEYGDLFERIRR